MGELTALRFGPRLLHPPAQHLRHVDGLRIHLAHALRVLLGQAVGEDGGGVGTLLGALF